MINVQPEIVARLFPTWSWCRVCGGPFWVHAGGAGKGDDARCWRHLRRNPCCIEGCTRSRSAPESGRLGLGSWMCGEHWRRFVPPRSLRRRAYNAFWRKAKRYGWTDELVEQFHRFWVQLVATARAKADGGTINRTEIHKMFGWD